MFDSVKLIGKDEKYLDNKKLHSDYGKVGEEHLFLSITEVKITINEQGMFNKHFHCHFSGGKSAIKTKKCT